MSAKLFGRTDEIHGLLGAITSGERLVTLRGTAGVGKSRLAAEVAARAPMPHLVVEIGAARDEAGMVAEIGRALDLPITSADAATQIGRALQHRRLLLVLDEAEAHVAALRSLLPRIAQIAPGVQYLVTSRVRIGLADERIVPLEPLGIEEAAALLADRVARLGAAPPAAGDAIELARRVGGVPLALELASSWVALLGSASAVEQIALAAPDAAIDLAASIDASLRLLSPTDRDALVSLAPLEGSFDLETADAVLGAPAVLTLRRLHEASLLRPVGDSRFELYTHVREVVSARPEPVAAAARARRDVWFAEMAEQVAGGVVGRDAPQAMRRFHRELHHLRSVAQEGELHAAVRVGRSIAIAALPAGPLRTVDESLGTLLARPGLSALDEAALRAARAGILRRLSRFHEAAAEARRAVDIAEGADDASVLATALQALGTALSILGRHEPAIEALRRAVTVAPADDLGLSGEVRSALGAALAAGPSPDEAEEQLQEALALLARAERSRARVIATLALAKFLVDQSRVTEAAVHFREALSLGRDQVDRYAQAMAWIGLAYVAHLGWDPRGADDAFARALDLFEATGLHWMAWVHRIYQAQVFASRGDDDRAIALYEECVRMHAELGSERFRALAESGLAACLAPRDRQRAADLLGTARRRAVELHEPTLDELISLHEVAFLRPEEAAARLREARNVVPGRSERTLVVDALARTFAARPPTATAPRIDRDGRWIVSPSGEATPLEHRPSLQGVLRALVRARLERPGMPIDRDELRRAGWGDERMLEAAAAQRIRTALATLRRAGLRDLLRTEPAGWFLAPDAPLDVRDAARPDAADR
jgi:tetratricopeptide (TPR) repeat protein